MFSFFFCFFYPFQYLLLLVPCIGQLVDLALYKYFIYLFIYLFIIIIIIIIITIIIYFYYYQILFKAWSLRMLLPGSAILFTCAGFLIIIRDLTFFANYNP